VYCVYGLYVPFESAPRSFCMKIIRYSILIVGICIIACMACPGSAAGQGEVIYEIKTGNDVIATALSMDGSAAVVGSRDDSVYFIDLSNNREWSYATRGDVICAAVSPEGDYVAAGSADNFVYIFSPEGSLLWKISKRDDISSVDFSSDGGYLAVGSLDNTVSLFTVDGALLWTQVLDSDVYEVDVAENGMYVVAGGNDNRITLLDSTGTKQWWHETSDVIRSVGISDDGQVIVGGGDDNIIYLFDPKGEVIGTITTVSHITAVTVSHDGQSIAAGTEGSTYNIYYCNNAAKLLWKDKLPTGVVDIGQTYGGEYLVAGTSEGVFGYDTSGSRIWEAMMGNNILSLSVSGDGAQVLAGSIDTRAYLISSGTYLSIDTTDQNAPPTETIPNASTDQQPATLFPGEMMGGMAIAFVLGAFILIAAVAILTKVRGGPVPVTKPALNEDSVSPEKVQKAQEWYNKGLRLSAEGKYLEAIDCYDRGLGINPEDADSWFNRGYALDALGHYDEALESYTHALTLNPSDIESWVNKGSALMEMERYKEAMNCFNQALELQPDFALAWDNKGASLLSLGIVEEARACFDRALELDPDNPTYLAHRRMIKD
jgi:WD40 repeat protein/Tfp pilus assembly protein PilF